MMEALRAYRASSAVKTITILIPTIFLILLTNHRRIVGWLIYHTEYISAVKGENLIGDSCKYILKEQNIWQRTEYNADWFMRSRCDANLAVETYNYPPNFPLVVEVVDTFSRIFNLGRTNFAKVLGAATTHVTSAASFTKVNSILTVNHIKALGLFLSSILGSWFVAATFNIGYFVGYYMEVFRTTTYTFSMTRSYLDLVGWGLFIILFILQYNQHEKHLWVQRAGLLLDCKISWFNWLVLLLRSIVISYRQCRLLKVSFHYILHNILLVLYHGFSATEYIVTTPFKIFLICTWSASSYDTKRAQMMTRLIWCFLYSWPVLFLYFSYNFAWFSFVVSNVWPVVFSAVDWLLNAPSYMLFPSWVVFRYMYHICTGNWIFAWKATQLSSFVQYLTNALLNNVKRFLGFVQYLTNAYFNNVKQFLSFVWYSYSFQMVAPFFAFVWYMYIYWANYQFMDATRLLQFVWYSIKFPLFFIFVWYVYWLNDRIMMEVNRFLESRFMKVTRFLKLIWDSINCPLIGGSTSQPAVARNNNILVYIADSLLQLLYSYLILIPCQWILNFNAVPMSLALPGFLFYAFCHALLNWSFNLVFRINTYSTVWFLVKIIQEVAIISLYCAISQFLRYDQIFILGTELLRRILCEEAIAGDYGSIQSNIVHRIPLCAYTTVRLILQAGAPLAINCWIDAVKQWTWISHTINRCNITNDPSKALLLPALFIAFFNYETAISTRLQDIFFLATSTLSVLLLSMKEFREPRTRKNMVLSESEPYAYDCIPVGPSPPFRPFWALAILNTFVALLIFAVPGGEGRYSIAALARTWNSTSNLAIYIFGFTFIVYLAMRLIPGLFLVRAHANLPNRPRKRNGYPLHYVNWYTEIRTNFDDEDIQKKTFEKARAFLSEGPLNFPVGILKLQFLLVAILIGQLIAPGVISLTVMLAIWLGMKFGVVGHLACNFDILVLNFDHFGYNFDEDAAEDLRRAVEAARRGVEAPEYEEVRNTEEGIAEEDIAEEDIEPLPSSAAQSEDDGESVSDNCASSTSPDD